MEVSQHFFEVLEKNVYLGEMRVLKMTDKCRRNRRVWQGKRVQVKRVQAEGEDEGRGLLMQLLISSEKGFIFIPAGHERFSASFISLECSGLF